MLEKTEELERERGRVTTLTKVMEEKMRTIEMMNWQLAHYHKLFPGTYIVNAHYNIKN